MFRLRTSYRAFIVVALTELQGRKIEPYFPLPHGASRVDIPPDELSSAIIEIGNGLRWSYTRKEESSPNVTYSRSIGGAVRRVQQDTGRSGI
jgi:hypothetical protein